MGKENTTFYVILGLLTHEDMTGYDIKKRVDNIISNFWSAGYGQIYPALRMLEQEGLVNKSTTDASKGTEKFIYSITESGRSRLLEWLTAQGEKEQLKYEILIKLFFGNNLSKGKNLQRIEEFRERRRKSLRKMDMFKRSLHQVLDESDDHFYYYLTVLFGEHVYRAYINWADEAVKLLKECKENHDS
jgi:DNA-binding PadR family transcriptional regulator